MIVETKLGNDPSRDYLIAGDAEGYWDLGADLANGREYAVHEPPRRVLRTPGLPIVVATSITFFGESRTAARGILAALAAIGPLMIFGLGWRVGGTKVGLIAGLLAAVSPLAVGLSPVILSDGLFAALLALQLSIAGPLVGCGVRSDDNRPTLIRAGLLGLSAGFAVLVRPAWLPAVPIVAVMLFVFGRGIEETDDQTAKAVSPRYLSWARVGAFSIGFAIAMGPWVVRNAAVTDHFVPTSLWLGATLYDSFGPGADGGSNMVFFDNEAADRVGMTEYEVDRWYRQRSWRAVVDDPARAAKLGLAKQKRFWSILPRAEESPSQFSRFAVACWSLTVGGLAIVGLCRRRLSLPSLVLTLGPLCYFAALHCVFVGSMRYRMPAELPICVLAAIGLTTLFPNLISKQSAEKHPVAP